MAATAWTSARPPVPTFAAPLVSGFLAFALLYLRAPDAFINPQFWAEDGAAFWQHQARFGWPVLFDPYLGYMLFAPRLVALAASFFDPALAPRLFAAGAIAITVWSAATAATCLRDRRAGALLGVGLILAPVAYGEIFGRISHLQWILAPTLALTLVSRPDANKLAFASLAAFTGPYCIFLAPLAAVAFYRSRNPVAVVCLVGAAVTIACLFLRYGRPAEFTLPNAAITSLDFVHIAGIMLFRAFNSIFALAAIGPIILFFAVTEQEDRAARLAELYLALTIMGAAVARLLNEPHALDFDNPDAGGRYFYVARVALIWCATSLLFLGPIWRRTLSLLFIVAMIASGFPLQRDPLPDAHWAEKIRSGAKQIEISPPGWVVTVP